MADNTKQTEIVAHTPIMRMTDIWARAREPVDASGLAVLRIALGLLIVYDALRKGDHLFGSNTYSHFRFTYEGFGWVPSAEAWAPYLAHIWFIAGLLVVLGLFYRPAMIVTTILTIFGFLQAREYYLNHYYLLIIVCFLMCLVPANKAFALDCLWSRNRNQPAIVARMHMWLLKGQTEIVLIYAGLVKLNSDWLNLEPLRSWLLQSQDKVFFGALFQYDWVIATGNYGIIILHILGAPLLLWRRTRLPIFLVYCAFHISNHFVFNIGIFPWMTIAMSTLFFPSHWPRQVAKKCAGWLRLAGHNVWQSGEVYAGHGGWKTFGSNRSAMAFAAFACVWLVSQSLLPLRHYLYEADVAWTREGHEFAWRMKLIDRWSPGFIAVAYLPAKNLFLIPPVKNLLTQRQFWKISTRPRLAQQLAPQLAQMIRETYKVENVRIHYYYPVGYNNREASLLIDPKVDMVRAPLQQHPASWIITRNDKPLRRLEQFSAAHRFPDFRDIASMMRLPRPVLCKNMPNKWLVCDVAPNRHLSRVGQ